MTVFRACREQQSGDYRARLVAAVALAFCLVAGLRTAQSAILFGDEMHSLFYGVGFPYSTLFTTYLSHGAGLMWPVLQKTVIHLLGDSVLSYRLVALVGAAGSVGLLFIVGSRIAGRVPAAIAALALSTNGVFRFYSSFGRVYSTTVLVGLTATWVLSRALSMARPAWRWYAASAVCLALVPYAHAVAAPFSVGLLAAALGIALVMPKFHGHARAVAATAVAAAAVCVLLYLPAWSSFRLFIRQTTSAGLRQYSTPFTWFDVAVLFAGGRVAAIAWLVATTAGVAALWYRCAAGASLLLAASAFTIVGLGLVRPDGMTYEYARYSLVVLPYLMLFMAVAVCEGAAAVARWRKLGDGATNHLALAVGVALVVVNMVAGPRGVRQVSDGRFANTYLSMMPLPAFDVPWSGTPRFYKWIAQQKREFSIVESPPILDRGLHLYRQYYLQHRHPVLIGEFSAPSVIPATTAIVWPMIRVDDPVALVASGAEYLVVHHRCPEEIRAYLHEIGTEIWPGMQDAGVQSLMYRNLTGGHTVEPPQSLLDRLHNAFGPPVFEDHYVVVWRLRPAGQS